MGMLADWIKTIQTQFKKGCPNGNLLEWDRNRYSASIKRVSKKCKVINQTDFNYAYCNTYEIRPKSLNEKYIYELTLSISFIVNAFVYHWTRYTLDMKKGKVIPISEIEVEYDPTDELIKLMKEYGYTEVVSEWFDRQIENVQLELAENATLGKCLFHDYE